MQKRKTKTPQQTREGEHIFFSSDFHFFHENIIHYSNRPFLKENKEKITILKNGETTTPDFIPDVEQMNNQLILNWNKKVKKDDTAYILGDFGFAPVAKLQAIFDQMNGKKHLIVGNHDNEALKIKGWKSIEFGKEIKAGRGLIVLCHYAMKVWNSSHHGSIQLYGHSHNSLPGNNQSLDVGVDAWDYAPCSLNEILEKMKKLPPYSI